jgi:hypothetical protein
MSTGDIYANPLTPRALQIARERDRLAAENAQLRAALAEVMLPIEALNCTEQGGIALAPLIQEEIANAVRVGRAALAATAPAAPEEPT